MAGTCSSKSLRLVYRFGLLIITTFVFCHEVNCMRPVLMPIQELLPTLIKEYQRMPKLKMESRILKMNEVLEYWYNLATQLKFCRDQCGSITWKSPKTNSEFFHPLVTAGCFSKCANSTDAVLRLNLAVLKDMMVGMHYRHLHSVHFSIDEYEMAARNAYSYWLRNPRSDSKLILSKYLGAQQHFRDVEPAAYHRIYFEGVNAYNDKDWSRAVKKLETAAHLYYSEFDSCAATCEYIAVVVDHHATDFQVGSVTFLTDNITTGNEKFSSPLLDDDKKSQTKKTHRESQPHSDSFRRAIRYLAECIHTCRHRLDNDGYETRNGPYHPQIYHYMQFAYNQLGELQRASAATQSFLTLQPNDEVMQKNKDCYLHTADKSHSCFMDDASTRVTLTEDDFVADPRAVKFSETARFVDAVIESYAPKESENDAADDETVEDEQRAHEEL